jgi:hypothetical protein
MLRMSCRILNEGGLHRGYSDNYKSILRLKEMASEPLLVRLDCRLNTEISVPAFHDSTIPPNAGICFWQAVG